MPFQYEHARPAVAVDLVVLNRVDADLNVLLIRRAREPFRNAWALPGGFMEIDETLEQAAIRELQEETGLQGTQLEQLHAFSQVDRDPRDRIISVAFLVRRFTGELQADDDASDARWFSVTDPPALAFDHDRMLQLALDRTRESLIR